jgi:RecA/RadA recombinase
LCRLDK